MRIHSPNSLGNLMMSMEDVEESGRSGRNLQYLVATLASKKDCVPSGNRPVLVPSRYSPMGMSDPPEMGPHGRSTERESANTRLNMSTDLLGSLNVSPTRPTDRDNPMYWPQKLYIVNMAVSRLRHRVLSLQWALALRHRRLEQVRPRTDLDRSRTV